MGDFSFSSHVRRLSPFSQPSRKARSCGDLDEIDSRPSSISDTNHDRPKKGTNSLPMPETVAKRSCDSATELSAESHISQPEYSSVFSGVSSTSRESLAGEKRKTFQQPLGSSDDGFSDCADDFEAQPFRARSSVISRSSGSREPSSSPVRTPDIIQTCRGDSSACNLHTVAEASQSSCSAASDTISLDQVVREVHGSFSADCFGKASQDDSSAAVGSNLSPRLSLQVLRSQKSTDGYTNTCALVQDDLGQMASPEQDSEAGGAFDTESCTQPVSGHASLIPRFRSGHRYLSSEKWTTADTDGESDSIDTDEDCNSIDTDEETNLMSASILFRKSHSISHPGAAEIPQDVTGNPRCLSSPNFRTCPLDQSRRASAQPNLDVMNLRFQSQKGLGASPSLPPSASAYSIGLPTQSISTNCESDALCDNRPASITSPVSADFTPCWIFSVPSISCVAYQHCVLLHLTLITLVPQHRHGQILHIDMRR